ncbi:hypothetical protein E8E12_010387 [Didymella heteroderae]|uniref:Clr5 domain-containing protein n=1 Tax=Didymella heteroderae TaxID=1769908 RepID=A0A9P5C3Y6_9PLEO|nr:hypothetical protein E8E12_010387 [Didymella heteroderae]
MTALPNGHDVSNDLVVPTGPSKRKPKATTLRDQDWEPLRARIVELHIIGDLPLKTVKEVLQKEYGFHAEIRQYRSRISKWKLDKNVKPVEMMAIVRKLQERRIANPDKRLLRFQVRKNEVGMDKISRWMKSHRVPDDQLYDPRIDPLSPTPSAVTYQASDPPY